MKWIGPPVPQSWDIEIYFQGIMMGLGMDKSEILLYYITMCHTFLEKRNYQISQKRQVTLVEVRATWKIT